MTANEDEQPNENEGGGAETPEGSSDGRSTVIGWRTALLLYALLILACCVLLKGKALVLGLIIVLGLGVKSFLHFFQSRGQ